MARDKQGGIITVEASLILTIFIAAYMALLSMLNVYRAYTSIQNAIDQSAKQMVLKMLQMYQTTYWMKAHRHIPKT